MSLKEHELVVIMFADIAGYTALMQKSEEEAKKVLDRFESTFSEAASEFEGVVVNSYGDGCLIKFYSVESALEAAINAQTVFLSTDPKIAVRIGVHLGDVFLKNGNMFGNNVNIASRLESFAVPGSILLSEEVYDQIRNKDNFKVNELGRVKFKNDQKTRSIYALSSHGLVVPKRSKLKGKGKLKSRGLVKFFWALMTLVVISAIAYHQFGADLKEEDLSENSIAVIPFINLSQATESLDYLTDGLPQEIIDELAKIKSFSVSPFTQSMYYKNSSLSASEIAEELSVKYLVSGSLRSYSEHELKMSIELFDPRQKKILWTNNFEDKIINAQKFQIDIAKAIASTLKANLSEEELEAINTLNTDNGEALRLFLKAKSEMDKFTEQGFQSARNLLSKAIDLDSNYAQAYTLKAWSYILSGDPQINTKAYVLNKPMAKADSLIEKSIKLRPDYSDSYLVRSGLRLFGKNDIAGAIEDIDYAIKLKSWPRIPTNYCTCNFVTTFIAANDFEKAEELIQIAEEVDPNNILQYWDHGNLHLAKKEFTISENYFRKAFDENQNSYFQAYLALSLYHQRKYDELLQLYSNDEIKDQDYTLLSLAVLSNTHFNLGNENLSNEYLNIIRNNPNTANLNGYLSMIYLGRDQEKTALEYLDKANELNEYGLAFLISTFPDFEPLYDEESFIKIKARMTM